MEQQHRQIILQNIKKLIEYTDYEKLLNACVQGGMLSIVMKNEILKLQENNRHYALFVKITQRGPTAYNQLYQIFSNLEFDRARDILSNNCEYTSIRKKKEIHTIQIHQQQQTANPDNGVTKTDVEIKSSKPVDISLKEYIPAEPKPKHLLPVRRSTKIYDDNKIESYPMRKKSRGIFFMVNIIDFQFGQEKKRRNGAEIDGEALLNLFHEMGYVLFTYDNLTREEFYVLLDEVLESKQAREAESFVMALMTHGSMMDRDIDRVEFHDSSVEKINNILDKFRNDVCLSLVNKPKLFIFPFCRGDVADAGTYKKIETDSIVVKPSSNIPTYSDMLLCYASVPGFQTHREPDRGSWYVQMLYEIFAKHAHDTHIEDMLKMVGERTAHFRTKKNNLQTASFANYGFNKKLFFNPGFYEEE